MNEQNNKKDLDEIDKIILKNFLKGFGKIMILWLLNKEKSHGYSLTKKINEMYNSQNEIINTSTVYPILHKLEKEEAITKTEKIEKNRTIKIYQITPLGKEKLSKSKKLFHEKLSKKYFEFVEDVFIPIKKGE
ncbi:MAG: PadR family transcriptional regulator [Methanobacteriaceae archaeon]|nr:PadR family transcriptional regulator [Methanobacteriaceae archaeon]